MPDAVRDQTETVVSLWWRRLPDELIRWGLSGLLGIGAASLVLAMVGLMIPWLVWPLGLGLTYLVSRWIPDAGGRQSSTTGAYLAVLVALAAVAIGWVAPHEHILGGRDPGTYVNVATWTAQTGELRIDSGTEVFGDAPLVYSSQGFPLNGSGTHLNSQFMHLFPAVMALFGATFGLGAIYLVTPITGGLALLGLFAFARRILSDSLAAAVCLILAVTLPFLYFSRAPFSELTAMAFLFAGLWVVSEALAQGSTRFATGAGLFLGSVFLARIDGVFVLLALAVYFTWLQVVQGSEADQAAIRRTWAVASAVALFGFLVDGLLFTPVYIGDHGTFIAAAIMGILAARVVGGILVSRGGDRWVREHQRPLGNLVAGVVGSWLAYAGLIRPHVEAPTKSDVYGISGLQEAAGVAVEPLRSYAELSVRWLVWYLGLVVVVVGLVWMTTRFRALITGEDSREGLFTIVMTLTTLTYLYRPSINPDHIWAMRRFLPVVLPGLVILAVWMGREFAERFPRWRVLIGFGLATAFLTPGALTTATLGLDAEFEGGAEAAEDACTPLGHDAAVVFVGDGISYALMPMFRGWCGFPTAAEDPETPLTEDQLATLARTVNEAGHTLWVIDGSQGEVSVMDQGFEFVELTLFEPPVDWWGLPLTFGARRVTP